MNKFFLTLTLIISILLSGCNDSEPSPGPNPECTGPVKQITLVYAVNKNNLASALDLNMRQMTEGLRNLPKGEYVMYVFKTFAKELSDGKKKEMAGLYRAVSGSDTEFVLQKEYSRDILSTDPERMKEVFSDLFQEQGEIYNLFFWGHGMAWTPYFSDHSRSGFSSVPVEYFPETTSFGGDNNSTDWADIDEIRDALPDNKFETIWFDCCYMSNIETAYELRNKCKWMVGYPTEIASDGLPYHKVLPFVLKDNQDLAGGCDALYNYYNAKGIAVTVTVMDMSKIEAVASICSTIYATGENKPTSYGLQNYSRSSSNPYYDFGQFVREYAQANDTESLIPEFERALNDFVVFTIASDKDFNYRPIVKDNYSGVSTHLFLDNANAKDKYYKELSWYKATYGVNK